MLWACLHFSDLPLRAVFEDGEQNQPCAVVEGPRQRPCVAFANIVAKRSGVGAGRVLAEARAICSILQARPRDRAAEQRLLRSLAAWAYRFSSHVSLCEPDALLIEVGASLRLFGGWPALERRLRRELSAIGYAPEIAVTPIPAAACVLAAQHDGFFTDQPAPMTTALGFVPVAQSGLPAAAISLLYNIGARNLRDVFALPRPELARRIGPEALATLDRLRGLEHEVLALYQPPDRFEHRIELDDRVEAARRLCGELALFLAARDGGAQRCELVLEHEDKPATRIGVELLTPQREARTLYELVRSRLERAALTAPVCGIALVARDLPEFRPRHQDLFEPQREQGLEWPELAERLRAHLGDEAVRRLAAAADHRPEKAWRFATGVRDDPAPRNSSASLAPKTQQVISEARNTPPLPPAGEAAPQARVRVAHEAAIAEKLPHSGNATTLTPALFRQRERGDSEDSQAAIPGATSVRHPVSPSVAARDAMPGISQTQQLRPLWLLARALPLRGPPPRILAGPERIESGWWDGSDTRRDYYVVQTREGQRAWAFLVPGSDDGWMLHGWFA
jgi:protein ImuB